MGNPVPFIGPLPVGVPRPMVDSDTGKIVPTAAPAGGSKPAGASSTGGAADPGADAARQAQLARERAAAEAAAAAARAALAEAQRQAREALQRAQKGEQDALEAENKAKHASAKNKDETQRNATAARDKANTAWAEAADRKAEEDLTNKKIALQDAKKKDADAGRLSTEASADTRKAQTAFDNAQADKTSTGKLVDAAKTQQAFHEADRLAADAEKANGADAGALRNQADIAEARAIDADAAYGVAEAERELKLLQGDPKADPGKLHDAQNKLAAARDQKEVSGKLVTAARAEADADAAERDAKARPDDTAAAAKAEDLRDKATLAMADVRIADQQRKANAAQRGYADAQARTKDLDSQYGTRQAELQNAKNAKDDKEVTRLQDEVDKLQGQLFAARQAEAKAKGARDGENESLSTLKADRSYDAALQSWNGTAAAQREYGTPRLVTTQGPRGGKSTGVQFDERYDSSTFAVPVEGNTVTENDGKYSLSYNTAQHDLPCFADERLDMPRTAETVVSKEDGHWVMEVSGPRGSTQKVRLNDDAARLWDAYVEKSAAHEHADKVGAQAATGESERKGLDLSTWLDDKAGIEKAVTDTKGQVDAAQTQRNQWIDQWRKDHGAEDPASANHDGWQSDPALKPYDDALGAALENQAVALANQDALKKMLALDEAERKLYDVESGKLCSADSTDTLRGKVKTARQEAHDAVEKATTLKAETTGVQGALKDTPAKLADARTELGGKDKELTAAKATGDAAKITQAERARELAQRKVTMYETDLAWAQAHRAKTVDDDNFTRQYTDPKHSSYAALPAPNYNVTIVNGSVVSPTIDLRSASSFGKQQTLDDAAKARDAARQGYGQYAQDIGAMQQAETDKPKVDTEVTNAQTGLTNAQNALDALSRAPGVPSETYAKARAAVDGAQQTLDLALKHQQAVDATLRWVDADRKRLDAEARDRELGRSTDNPSDATKTARQAVADARTKATSLQADWTKAQQKHDVDTAQQHYDTLNTQHEKWLDAHPGADASRAPGYQTLVEAEAALVKAKGAQLQGASDAANARQQAFIAQHLDPSKRDDPAALDELFRKDPLLMAQGLINQGYLQTGGHAVDMAGRTHLKNTVALSLGWQPTETLDTSDAGTVAALLRTRDAFAGLSGDQEKLLNTVVDRILEKGGATPTLTVVPVVYSNKDSGIVSTALFRVQGQDGKVYYIDNQGGYGSGETSHDAVEDWRDNNTLSPDDVLVMPEDGELKLDDAGNVKLTQVAANHESTWDKVHPWLSAGIAVVGIVAGVVVTVGSAGILSAPGAVMIGAGVAGLVDGGMELNRMATHGQSIDPRENKQALLTEVSMLACALGTVASGARAGAELARGGSAMRLFGNTARVVGWGATATGGYAVAQPTWDLATHWDELSGSQKGWGVFNATLGGLGMVSGFAATRGKTWMANRGAAVPGGGTPPPATRTVSTSTSGQGSGPSEVTPTVTPVPLTASTGTGSSTPSSPGGTSTGTSTGTPTGASGTPSTAIPPGGTANPSPPSTGNPAPAAPVAPSAPSAPSGTELTLLASTNASLVQKLSANPTGSGSEQFVVSDADGASVVTDGNGLPVRRRNVYTSFEAARDAAARRGGANVFRVRPGANEAGHPHERGQALQSEVMGVVHVNAQSDVSQPLVNVRGWPPKLTPEAPLVDRVEAPGLRQNFAGQGPDEPASVAVGFDGTWNDAADPSHVLRLLNRYQGDAAYYVPGVGTGGGRVDKVLGLAVGRGWRTRVDAGVDAVVRFAQANPDRPIQLDVFGFSRGAAQARVFANQVTARVQQQVPGAEVQLRFLGLFDTVSTGMFRTPGSRQQLVVPDAVRSAAQAVSLHEPNRLFPLDSIADSAAAPLAINHPTRTELTFASDHPAVGGHVHAGVTEASQVPFHWMQQRARAAGVPVDMQPLPLDAEPGPVHVRRDAPAPRKVGERNVRFPATGTRGQALNGMAGLTTDAAGRLILPAGPNSPRGTHGWMAPGEYTTTVTRAGYFEDGTTAVQRAAAEGAQPVPEPAAPRPGVRHRLAGVLPGGTRGGGRGEAFRTFDEASGREAVWYRPGSAPREVVEGYARMLQQQGRHTGVGTDELVAQLNRRHLVVVREGTADGGQQMIGAGSVSPRWKGARRVGFGGPDRGVHVRRDVDGSRVKRGDGRLDDVVGVRQADAQDTTLAALDGAQRFTRVQRLLWSTSSQAERSFYDSGVPGAKRSYDVVQRDAPDRLRALPEDQRSDAQNAALAAGGRRKQLLALSGLDDLPDGLRVTGYEAKVSRPLGPVGKFVKLTDPNSYLGRLNGTLNPVRLGIAGVNHLQQRNARPVELDTAPLDTFDVPQGATRRSATLYPPGTMPRELLIEQAGRVKQANRGLPGSPYETMTEAEVATQLDGLHVVRVTETGADGSTQLVGGASVKANWKGSDGKGRWLDEDLPHRAAYLGHVFGARGGGGQATQAAGAAAARLRAPELDFYTRWPGAQGLYAKLRVPVVDARFTPEAPRLLLDADARTVAALPNPLRDAVQAARTRPAGEQEAALKASLDQLQAVDFHTQAASAQGLHGQILPGGRKATGFAPDAAKTLLRADPAAVDGLPPAVRDAVVQARGRPKAEQQADLEQRLGRIDLNDAQAPVLPNGVLRVSYRQPLDADPGWAKQWMQGGWRWTSEQPPVRYTVGKAKSVQAAVTGRPTAPQEIETFPARGQTSGIDRRARLYPPGTLPRDQLALQAERVLEANQGLPGSPYARMTPKQVAEELDSLYVVQVVREGAGPTLRDADLMGGAALRPGWKGPQGDSQWLGDALPAEAAYLSHVFGRAGGGQQATAAAKTAAGQLRAQELDFYTRWSGAQVLYRNMGTPQADVRFTPQAPDLLLTAGPATLDSLPAPVRSAVDAAKAQPPQQQRAHLENALGTLTPGDFTAQLPNGVLRVSYRVPLDGNGPWTPHWTQRLRGVGGSVKPAVQATGRGLSRAYEAVNPHAGPKTIEPGRGRQALRDASYLSSHARRTALKFAVAPWAVANVVQLATGQAVVHRNDDAALVPFNALKGSDSYSIYFPWTHTTLSVWNSGPALRGLYGLSESPAQPNGRYGASPVNPAGPRSATGVMPARANLGEWGFGLQIGNNETAWRMSGGVRLANAAYNNRLDIPAEKGGTKGLSILTSLTPIQPNFNTGVYVGPVGVINRDMLLILGPALQTERLGATAAASSSAIYAQRHGHVGGRVSGSQGTFFTLNAGHGKPEPDWGTGDATASSAPAPDKAGTNGTTVANSVSGANGHAREPVPLNGSAWTFEAALPLASQDLAAILDGRSGGQLDIGRAAQRLAQDEDWKLNVNVLG